MPDLKQQAIEIFLRTLEAIDVKTVFDRKIRVEGDTLIADDVHVDLSPYEEVVVIGLGKASLKMGRALIDVMGGRVRRGLLVTGARDATVFGPGIEVIVGGHPVPTLASLQAGERLLETVASCGPRSLIIFLISGGGSALAESLASPNVSLEELRILNQLLIQCGASIQEINTIRKCISRIKGGGLGRLAANVGAESLAIYISDVNPGDLRSIASNPILPEPRVGRRAQEIIERYVLGTRLPASVIEVLESKAGMGSVDETVSLNRAAVLLCDNDLAIECASVAARNLGFATEVCHDLTEGDYREVAGAMIDRFAHLREEFPDRALCLVSGGEVSCVVTGSGVGGRNQEFVLYSATKLAEQWIGIGSIAVLSCGTDGIDGNSAAAGAVSDRLCIEEAIRNGIDPGLYLRENDSFSFFSKMGGLVLTGPTGTNVRDIRLLLGTPNDQGS